MVKVARTIMPPKDTAGRDSAAAATIQRRKPRPGMPGFGSTTPASGVEQPIESRARPATPVNAVASAMKILSDLSRREAPVGVTQLARELKLNTSTCFNILQTLAQGELVRMDPATKTYAIGMGIVDLARDMLARDSELPIIRPMMERIARTHGITVVLLKRTGPDDLTVVELAIGDGPMRITLSIGQNVPLLLGASGLLMAAFSGFSETELRTRFDRLAPFRELPFAEFQRNVEQTRARGWAVDEGHFVRGTVSVSVPLFSEDGKPGLACSGTMFVGQYSEAKSLQIAKDLGEIAQVMRSRRRR